MMKTCSKCGVEKPAAEFSKGKRGKDGLRSECKACASARAVADYAAHPEKRQPALARHATT